jgi:hypothetical protein
VDFRSRPVIQAALVAAIFAGVGVGRTPAVVADTTTFVPLFNGTDFTGWRFGDEAAMPREIPAAWKIENGVIVGTGDPTAILASQWDYGDFELEFEWRAGADTVDADVHVHASRMLDADPIRITKDLAGGPQENDRGEGLYNASATSRRKWRPPLTARRSTTPSLAR